MKILSWLNIFNNPEKSIILKNFLLFLFLIISAVFPGFVFAADKWGVPDKPEGIPESAGDLAAVLMNIINWVLGFIAFVAILMLIWGGVRYITAAGDESQVEDAKNIIAEAVIGLTIVGISYAIVVAVVNVWIGGKFS